MYVRFFFYEKALFVEGQSPDKIPIFAVTPNSTVMEMKTNRKRDDSILVAAFLFMLASGVVLHLKRHGLVIEPRDVIKAAHGAVALVMVIVIDRHYLLCRNALQAMGKRHPYFPKLTVVLLWAFVFTAVTGAVKCLTPVKIPYLGMVHYWCGIVMSVTAIGHLVVGLPLLLRKWRS